ncbi:Regulator of G-protein signaling [Cichlidogyrus casuarinus]|uniref:Regulator of G-protein signaling n=1 Tax=Cichlidogyrus casuarinus TaxID=1844966 RepID=A0ABD2QDG4_9PLAT
MDKTIRPEKLIELGDILVDENASAYFRQFLLQEHSEENLDFYKAVTAWKKQLKNLPFGLKSSAFSIYQDYIADNAINWVNLDCNVSKQIFSHLSTGNTLPADMKQVSPQQADQTVPKSIFDSALREIYYLMERDSFPRFLDSTSYQQFLLSLSSSKGKLLSLSLTNLSR